MADKINFRYKIVILVKLLYKNLSSRNINLTVLLVALFKYKKGKVYSLDHTDIKKVFITSTRSLSCSCYIR